jgi:serine/threonine protein phosphatase 1
MSEALAIVGDVHGDAVRLRAALSRLDSSRRRIVFVGDYIDRGPDSAEVIEALIGARAALGSMLVLLAGNHEAALVDYIDTADLVRFAAFGGMATIRSYVGKATPDVHSQFVAAMPDEHQRLIREDLLPFYETETVLVSHSGFDPGKPLDRGRAAMVETGHPDLFSWTQQGGNLPRPTVVFGHYVQRSMRPYDSGGLVCLDTGCGTIAGPLTVLLLPEHRYMRL